jgi:hypothetical protein
MLTYELHCAGRLTMYAPALIAFPQEGPLEQSLALQSGLNAAAISIVEGARYEGETKHHHHRGRRKTDELDHRNSTAPRT